MVHKGKRSKIDRHKRVGTLTGSEMRRLTIEEASYYEHLEGMTELVARLKERVPLLGDEIVAGLCRKFGDNNPVVKCLRQRLALLKRPTTRS